MIFDSPAAVVRAFAEYVETRKLEPLLELYEPDALFIPEPQVRLIGRAQLRQAFSELFSSKPVLTLSVSELHEVSELAFVSNAWTLRAVAPDGQRVERSGQSSVVMRRGADGGFRIVIDRL